MDLNTDRLHIRNLCEDDWMDMKRLFIDFNDSKYAAYDRHLPVDDTEAKVLTKKFADSELFFGIYLRNENQMIGYVCFHKDKEAYDLGYCFHSAFHSNGYAYESAKALIDYFVKEHGVKSFTAGTAINNIPSCRLLKKLGFLCISTELISFHDDSSFQGGNFVLNLE